MAYIVKEAIKNNIKRLTSIEAMLKRKKEGGKVTVNFSLMNDNMVDSFRMIAANIQEMQFAKISFASTRLFQRLKEKAIESSQNAIALTSSKELAEITDDEYLKVLEPFFDIYDMFKEEIDNDLERVSIYDADYPWRSTWEDGDFELSPSDITGIFSCFNLPNRPITFLDINAARGRNVKSVAESRSNLKCYGISDRQYVNSTFRRAVERLVAGGLKNCRVPQDSFDLVYCSPMLEQSDEAGMSLHRSERKMVRFAMERARTEGLVVIAMPLTRYYKDISTDIARQLQDIKVIPSHDESVAFVIGRKKEDHKGIDPKTYVKLRTAFMEGFESGATDAEKYSLPVQAKPINYFRGAILEDDEIIDMIKSSSAEKAFWEDQKVQKMSDADIHPILPLGFGQLGQAIASGLMDGIVHEGNSYSHLAKGRVIKVHDTHRDVDAFSHRVTISDTTSNRVEINVFLPNGEFKRLA